jgi:hypothetical protein
MEPFTNVLNATWPKQPQFSLQSKQTTSFTKAVLKFLSLMSQIIESLKPKIRTVSKSWFLSIALVEVQAQEILRYQVTPILTQLKEIKLGYFVHQVTLA